METPADEFLPYSVGLCYASVCTSLDDPDEITQRLNRTHPIGVDPLICPTERPLPNVASLAHADVASLAHSDVA
jgi:hypothetical protein